MRKRLALAMSVATAGSVVMLATPADAGQGVTFSLTAGLLTISEPADTTLGSVGTGTGTLAAQLGAVAVSDGRGALNGTWTASVASSDFTTGDGSASETIGKGQIDYYSGLGSTTGTAVFLPGQLLALNRQPLSASRTAYSATGVIGNTTASWNPTVIVNIPSAAVAGSYSGTITHSVSGS